MKQHHSSSDNHDEHTPDNNMPNGCETCDATETGTTETAGDAGEPATSVVPATSLADIAHEWLADHTTELYEWRWDFHAHPELSDQEYRTTATINSILRDHGLTPHLFPNTGLMVDIGPDTPEKLRSALTLMRSPFRSTRAASIVRKTPASCMHAAMTSISRLPSGWRAYSRRQTVEDS